jgi:hypothetical protein
MGQPTKTSDFSVRLKWLGFEWREEAMLNRLRDEKA